MVKNQLTRRVPKNIDPYYIWNNSVCTPVSWNLQNSGFPEDNTTLVPPSPLHGDRSTKTRHCPVDKKSTFCSRAPTLTGDVAWLSFLVHAPKHFDVWCSSPAIVMVQVSWSCLHLLPITLIFMLIVSAWSGVCSPTLVQKVGFSVMVRILILRPVRLSRMRAWALDGCLYLRLHGPWVWAIPPNMISGTTAPATLALFPWMAMLAAIAAHFFSLLALVVSDTA